jgi:hypothetical protein
VDYSCVELTKRNCSAKANLAEFLLRILLLPVEHIHTYLVHPGKGSTDTRQIGGTELPLKGKLFSMLGSIYSNGECNIDISFNNAPDGSQKNLCRDLVVDYVGGPTLIRGRRLAEKLEKVTTLRSGLGLLFLIAGTEGQNRKLVISRFPADSGVLVEEGKSLSVEFLERVFMKNSTTYKAATYEHSSLHAGFWTGLIIDKQINSRDTQVSNYWITEFLESSFRTTAAHGTRRLAVALREAAKKSSDVRVKQEIVSAATLAENFHGKRLSIDEFQTQLNLSGAAREAIAREVGSPAITRENFQFDLTEFQRQAAYRSVELDSGALLTAPSAEFSAVFRREKLDPLGQKVRYSTEGIEIDDKLGKDR